MYQSIVSIQLASMFQTTCPGKNRSNRIGRSFPALLMLAIVTGNSAVCSFCFHSFSIGSDKHRRHQAKRTETLSHCIRLNISIIVFTCPNKTTIPFHCRSHHIVDQSVLIHNTGCLKFGFKFLFVNFLKYIFETSIVSFQNCILCRHIQWPFFLQRYLKR